MPYTELYLRSRTHAEMKAMKGLKDGKIVTGHATFDKAANNPETGHVGEGTVMSSVQRSYNIRPYDRAEANGRDYERGELQKADLDVFRKSGPGALGMFRKLSMDREIIAYEFLTPTREGRRVIGWVATDTWGRFLEAQENMMAASTEKTRAVMAEMIARVSWDDKDLKDPVDTAEILRRVMAVSPNEAREIIEQQGYRVIAGAKEAREARVHFSDHKPFTAWDDPDLTGEPLRAESLPLLLALVAVRENDPDIIPEPEIDEPRYVISDPDVPGQGWEHLFREGTWDMVRKVRFVWDREKEEMVSLFVKHRGRWAEGSAGELADLEDSLVNANSDVLENPKRWGLVETAEIPDWASLEESPSPS